MKSVKLSRLALAIFLTLAGIGANATPADTLLPDIPTRIIRYTEQDWSTGDYKNGRDTSFQTLHQPDRITAENGKNLSALGTPSQLLYFNPTLSPFANAGISLYQPYLLDPGSIEYLRTNKRLTRLNYHMASFREQSIEAFHSQNILKNWNAGLQFLRFDVKDFLIRSDTYYNRFLFFTDYESQNKRYHLFANCFWNSFKNQLNGGVADDSLIEGKDNGHLDLKGLPVSLSAAGNRFREKSFHVSQYLRLDNPRDTQSTALELQLNSTLTSGSLTYFDQLTDTSVFYENYYYGLVSYDSIGYKDFRNRAGLSLRSKQMKSSGLHVRGMVFVEHQLYDYHQAETQRRNNLAIGGVLQLKLNVWHVDGQLKSIVSGADHTNYSGDLALKHQSEGSCFGIRYSMTQGAVPLSYLGFSGNHFQWSNTFDPLHHARLSAFANHRASGFSIELFSDYTTGFIFMGNDALPLQYNGTVTVQGLQLQKDFNWRKWHFDNRIRYQKTNSDGILRLPEWSLTHHLYWENKLLHGACILSAGFQLRYISGYYGDAFMPATGFFYLQDSTRTFGVPAIDFITDFKIKLATLFLTCENATGGITGNYVMTPLYPQPSRVFRFGIRWFFLDQ